MSSHKSISKYVLTILIPKQTTSTIIRNKINNNICNNHKHNRSRSLGVRVGLCVDTNIDIDIDIDIMLGYRYSPSLSTIYDTK